MNPTSCCVCSWQWQFPSTPFSRAIKLLIEFYFCHNFSTPLIACGTNSASAMGIWLEIIKNEMRKSQRRKVNSRGSPSLEGLSSNGQSWHFACHTFIIICLRRRSRVKALLGASLLDGTFIFFKMIITTTTTDQPFNHDSPTSYIQTPRLLKFHPCKSLGQ